MQKIKDINQGDVLTFKTSDCLYKAILCIGTYKERSPHHYIFVATTYDGLEKPTIESILLSGFYGIGYRNNEYYKPSEYELENIWKFHPEVKPYSLGAYSLYIWRKDFMKFRGSLELIGNIKIIDNLDKNASGGMNASDWDYLEDFFDQKFKTVLPERGQEIYKISAILKK